MCHARPVSAASVPGVVDEGCPGPELGFDCFAADLQEPDGSKPVRRQRSHVVDHSVVIERSTQKRPAHDGRQMIVTDRQGVGIAEPFIAKPRSMDEAKQNMRVEFRLIRVSAEVTQESDFDF